MLFEQSGSRLFKVPERCLAIGLLRIIRFSCFTNFFSQLIDQLQKLFYTERGAQPEHGRNKLHVISRTLGQLIGQDNFPPGRGVFLSVFLGEICLLATWLFSGCA